MIIISSQVKAGRNNCSRIQKKKSKVVKLQYKPQEDQSRTKEEKDCQKKQGILCRMRKEVIRFEEREKNQQENRS